MLERELRIESLARIAASTRRSPGAALNESLALTYEAPSRSRPAAAGNGFPIERVLRDL